MQKDPLTNKEIRQLHEFFPKASADWDGIDYPTLRKILGNAEKAEKYDTHELVNVNEDWIAVERKVWDLERQENKKLKEKIGTVLADSHIANEQMTNANLELEQLKETYEITLKTLENMTRFADNYKEKLEKIKMFIDDEDNWLTLEPDDPENPRFKLNKILEGK